MVMQSHCPVNLIVYGKYWGASFPKKWGHNVIHLGHPLEPTFLNYWNE
jgi:hypothetical protein